MAQPQALTSHTLMLHDYLHCSWTPLPPFPLLELFHCDLKLHHWLHPHHPEPLLPIFLPFSDRSQVLLGSPLDGFCSVPLALTLLGPEMSSLVPLSDNAPSLLLKSWIFCHETASIICFHCCHHIPILRPLPLNSP